MVDNPGENMTAVSRIFHRLIKLLCDRHISGSYYRCAVLHFVAKHCCRVVANTIGVIIAAVLLTLQL
jgi:hypothetical protein